VITWSPAPMTVGTALTAAQLNATATAADGTPVAGSFVYSPALGTVETVTGNRTLNVTFTPSDTASYNKVAKSVTVTVTAAQ